MDGIDADSGHGKPYQKRVFKNRVHGSVVAKRISSESMLPSA